MTFSPFAVLLISLAALVLFPFLEILSYRFSNKIRTSFKILLILVMTGVIFHVVHESTSDKPLFQVLVVVLAVATLFWFLEEFLVHGAVFTLAGGILISLHSLFDGILVGEASKTTIVAVLAIALHRGAFEGGLWHIFAKTHSKKFATGMLLLNAIFFVIGFIISESDKLKDLGFIGEWTEIIMIGIFVHFIFDTIYHTYESLTKHDSRAKDK